MIVRRTLQAFLLALMIVGVSAGAGGWYLIVVPEDHPDDFIGQWRSMAAFDSAQECERARRGTRSDEAARGFGLSTRCVAADDPRLGREAPATRWSLMALAPWLLGRDFLDHFKYTVDNAAGRVTLTAK